MVCGLSHATASTDLRSKLQVAAPGLPGLLRELRAHLRIEELAILATCNRVELHCSGESAQSSSIFSWVANAVGLEPRQAGKICYQHSDDNAVRHLIRVASGLDSMALGETQILGQFKDAYDLAQKTGVIGPVLHRVSQRGFSAAKRIRTETEIGRRPISIASVAVKLAQQIFGSLEHSQILLIGAGENITLVAERLQAAGSRDITIANRGIDHGRRLANALGARAIPLTAIPDALTAADIVISSTGSDELILRKEPFQGASRKRLHRPVFLIDLAVPYDIDPEIASLPDAYLYNIDHLADLAAESRRQRGTAAALAEEIADAEATNCMKELHSLRAGRIIQALRSSAEDSLDAELSEAKARLAKGAPAEQVLENFGRRLTAKWLHKPSVELRMAAKEGRFDLLAMADQIHGLEAELSPADPAEKAPQDDHDQGEEQKVREQGGEEKGGGKESKQVGGGKESKQVGGGKKVGR